jgi:hypothetical protein
LNNIAIFLSFFTFGKVLGDVPQLNVVPYPSEVSMGSGSVHLDNTFIIHADTCHSDCEILHQAIDRYLKMIFKPVGSTGTVFRLSIFEDRINATVPTGASTQLTQLNVVIKSQVKLLIRSDFIFT